jgi:hypothetical protein
MKTTMRMTNRLFSMLFVASLLMACAKDGLDGADGKQGEPGTANVIYSEWIPSEFEDDIQFNSSSFLIQSRLITDEIINHGLILIYGKVRKNSDEFVFPLPVTFDFRNEAYYYNTEGEHKLSIGVRSIDGVSAVEDTYFAEYRYVLIPGGSNISARSYSGLKDYSKMSYREIAKRFNIPD